MVGASAARSRKALDVLRNRSTFLLMREAFYGTTRFDDFAERVGLSDPVTAARLRELVDEGLLEREDYREPGQRTRQALPADREGRRPLPGPRRADAVGRPLGERRRRRSSCATSGCGAKVGVELRCAAGHAVEAGDLDLAARRGRRIAS